MSVLDIVSFLVLAILIVGALFLILIVAAIPGVLAKKRHSPWAEPINVGGWIGVLLPPIWMLALIAAFVRPQVGEGAQIAIGQDETTELASAIANISQRVTNLQNKLHVLSTGGTGSGSVRP
jgi:ABC-type dipeptide/oligopeptide/nickel transport system permease component